MIHKDAPKSLARDVRAGDLVVGIGTVTHVSTLCGDTVLFIKNGKRERVSSFPPDTWLHVLREGQH